MLSTLSSLTWSHGVASSQFWFLQFSYISCDHLDVIISVSASSKYLPSYFWTVDISNSLHLAWKYARIFNLSADIICSIKTVSFEEQIYCPRTSIFSNLIGGYCTCVNYASNIFRNTRSLISRIFPSFCWGILR